MEDNQSPVTPEDKAVKRVSCGCENPNLANGVTCNYHREMLGAALTALNTRSATSTPNETGV